MDLIIEKSNRSIWTSISEEITIKIFHYLPASSLLKVAQVCKTYRRLALDESLWKDLFYCCWKVNRSIPMSPGKVSWVQEYKRLYYHTPSVESEIILSHTDEVLHVSFAHNGKMFATCSKDGFIKVWDKNNYPSSLKNQADMKRLKWECTAFSEFNESDTLLLVSGSVSAISPSAGEIVVFSLLGDFKMLTKVICTPYDVQGTWCNDFVVSGTLHQVRDGASCSDIWLHKATQKRREPVKKRIFRFHNKNSSHVRCLIIANVVRDNVNTRSNALTTNTQTVDSHPNQRDDKRSKLSVSMCDERNLAMKDKRESSDNTNQTCKKISDQKEKKINLLSVNADVRFGLKSVTSEMEKKFASVRASDASTLQKQQSGSSALQTQQSGSPALQTQQSGSSNDGLSSTVASNYQKNEFCCAKLSGNNVASGESSTSSNNLSDKYLIFSCGSETYAASHIGIKRFRVQDYIDETTGQLYPDVPNMYDSPSGGPFDNIEYIFAMHGKIIGMCLSPDHRYLYVNSRRWLDGYQIENPFKPPPLSDEILLHVFDLSQVKMVYKMDTSHKAYTPGDDCFFLHLDVCEDYVASGAEDKYGHMWDRHYGICLRKFSHSDVVNSVAFNPADQESLVTVSDDCSIKIWRSRNRVKNLMKSNLQRKEGAKPDDKLRKTNR